MGHSLCLGRSSPQHSLWSIPYGTRREMPRDINGASCVKKCFKFRFTIRIYVQIAISIFLLLSNMHFSYFKLDLGEKYDKKRTYSKDSDLSSSLSSANFFRSNLNPCEDRMSFRVEWALSLYTNQIVWLSLRVRAYARSPTLINIHYDMQTTDGDACHDWDISTALSAAHIRTCVTSKACAEFWRCFRTIWLRK